MIWGGAERWGGGRLCSVHCEGRGGAVETVPVRSAPLSGGPGGCHAGFGSFRRMQHATTRSDRPAWPVIDWAAAWHRGQMGSAHHG